MYGDNVCLIGMDFLSFLYLLIIAVVVGSVLYFLKVRLTKGWLTNVAVGWIGAWLGSPVLGNWWDVLRSGNVFWVPAIIGSAALIWLVAACQECCKGGKAE